MQTMRNPVSLAAFLLFCGLLARGQTPLARPLADFDKLVSQLNTSSLVGEPIRAGDTAVVPFARIQFGLGAGEAALGVGGGMSGQTIPLGVLIVEGDDVRVELLEEHGEKPTAIRQLIQAILERKVVFMVNGLNIGNAPGGIQEMAPLLSAMMGQTTVMVNGLNLGNLKAPASAASPAGNAPPGDLAKLFEARKYLDALAAADALIARDPRSADAHAWRGRILSSLAQGNPLDMMKYGTGAREEFDKALSLDPNNRNALLGRGISRLMAPLAYGGDVDGAIADLQKAIAKQPSPDAYYYLAEAFKSKGLKDKAAAAYRQALELRPNDPDLLKALAALK
jgi:tetratricopeptide (TPR) repeat protein